MNFDEFKKRALESDPDLRAEYEALAPQYEIIQSIITARLEQNITQAELARRINTKQSNISRLESGAYNPSVEFLGKVATALGKKLEIRFNPVTDYE